jgi:hypothetical protein
MKVDFFIRFLGLVFWNSLILEVASDSFCFLINSSWLLVLLSQLSSLSCQDLISIAGKEFASHRIIFLSSSFISWAYLINGFSLSSFFFLIFLFLWLKDYS